jgi:hypothetical protein
LKAGSRLGGQGHQHQALCGAIEAVHRINLGIQLTSQDPDHIRGPAPVPRIFGRMHRDPCGFFKNNKILIPVK